MMLTRPVLSSLCGTLLLALFLAVVSVSAAEPPTPQPPLPADHAEKMARGREVFTKQVRPTFLQHCVNCHGGQKTKGDLDLTTREGLLKGGNSGEPAVVPGKAKDSRLYRLVAHLEEPHMPSKMPKLGDEQLNAIAAWIDLGAPYDKPLIEKADAGGKKPLVVTDEDRRFWSFVPLTRPALPKVKDESWCRTPIDHFILAKLEEKGITPNRPADRRKLIRRAYFDLIGLPPPAGEVEAFVKDPAPDAYEKLIDRLLDDPHHGERWARHWLDIARFAESHGFEHDYDRPTAYHFRDFVIKAFNQDLPYDTFVKWQLAGDELAPDDPLALMATGFLAAGVHSTQITKNQVEKERYDELDDMLRTTGTAMLGMTIGCARCHDHKYDPIPTRDYYRMLSTFTTTVRSEMEVNLDPEGYRQAKAKFDAEHAKVTEPLLRYEKEELPKRLDEWLAKRAKDQGRQLPRWLVLEPVTSKGQGGTTFTPQPDGSLLAGGASPDQEVYTFVAQTHLKGITAVRLEALADKSLVKGGPGRAGNGNFALSDFRVTAAPLTPQPPLPQRGEGEKAVAVKLVNARATFEQLGLPVKAAIDGDKTSAWAVDPQFGKDHAAIFETATDVGFDGGTVLTFTLEFRNNVKHSIGRPRLAISTAARPVALDGEQLPEKVASILASFDADTSPKRQRGETLTDEQRGELLRWYRTLDPQWRQLSKKVEEHQQTAPRPPTAKVLISSEGVPAVRLHTQGGDFLEQTHFLKRGDPNQKGDVATQGFLQVLTRTPDQEKHWQTAPPAGWRTSYRRRALASWITDVDAGAGHLLARVIVNRLWQHHLGRGIVGTPSDFGFQGERPTHPELLDWLASELVRNGWRLKHIHKLIMTSAVYMETSDYDKQRAALDPDHRLCWRHIPHRLEAEIIRDNLLAVSGLLDERQFGPGTLDENHKRRSIYFTVKRSKLIPTMVLFDGPDALQGMERRPTTTIAPQALLLMNNPLVRNCADNFAKRISPPGEKSVPEVVRAGYAIALGRGPSEQELSNSVNFIQEQTAAYEKDGKANARQLALGDFCQVLVSVNEFMYID
jgi:mono/diheme cytochrome c family protein